jgi:CheY-like chemotaxis protein
MSRTDPVAPRGRILLVEDDADGAYYAVHVLTTMGHFEVGYTPDPAVALQRARSERWDLVLADADLPSVTGTELLEALRQAVPALPVAVMTAHVAIGVGMESLRRSADAFLEKPVPPARLIAVASALIAGAAACPSVCPC